MNDQNKMLARRLLEEGFSKGDLSVAEQCLAPNHVSHDPNNPPNYQPGPKGTQEIIKIYRTAFPDLKLTVDDQLADGDRVVTRWTARGTQKGPLMDIPPTGKTASITGVTIDRIQNGKVVESWINWDMAGLMQQLGVRMEKPKTDGGRAQPQTNR
ncbi:MAG: ester cyclase [Polyangiales bacterium]